MAVSGRVTGIAVDPSDPSRLSDLFHFNLDLLAEHSKDDPGQPGDRFDFDLTDGGKDGTASGFGGYQGSFTGGVYVATNAAELPLTDTALPAVQSDPVHDFSYGNSFTCIPDSVL